jgi:hypothetical protein
MHGDLFALGQSMIPLEVAGFVIGVYVELSGQEKMGIGDFVVLMSLNVLKCRWNLEIFQDVPIRCDGGGGVVGRVLTALNNAREKALIISGKNSGALNLIGAIVLKQLKESGARQHVGSFGTV